jgi:hypothetical protein
MLDNVVDGDTTGPLTIGQSAFGGSTGVLGKATGMLPLPSDGTSLLHSHKNVGSLTLSAVGQGGSGAGGRSTAGSAGDGAVGTAVADATNDGGAAIASSSAVGGFGGISSGNGDGGRGGAAHATALSAATGGNAVTATATATGGAGSAGSGAGHASGNGGAAIVEAARGTSAGAGPVLVTATQTGGRGGGGASGAANGNGASSVIENRVAGTTAGTLTLVQNAIGGNGGTTATTGGNGGAASSTLDLSDSAATTFGVTANATGGMAPTSGIAGAATALAQAAGANIVNVVANATSPSAAANASASAQTPAAPASADATASGLAALAGGTAQTTWRSITSAQGTANLPVSVRGQSRARAAIAQGIVPLADLTVNQDAAIVSAAPRNVDALLTLVSNPKLHQTLNVGGEGTGPRSDVLAVFAIGGGQPATATAAAQTFSASASVTVDPAKLSSPQDLILGLLHPQANGAGFDTMRFRLLAGANTLVDQTFSSVPTASAYFEDHTVDLGAWVGGGSAPVTLTVMTDVTASQAAQRFYASLVLANATPGSGGLPGDADRDGLVGFSDFQRLELGFGAPGDFAHGDFDGSGMVDTDDLRVFLRYYGQTAPAGAAEVDVINAFAAAQGVGVPEPGAIGLLSAGALGMLLLPRRRRST